MSKRPRLFAGYFLEWIETYKVGAIREISVSKYYIAHKHLTEICPDLTIDKLDRKAYQSILNEYALTHERQTTMDFHHQIGSCVRDMYHEGLIKRDPTYKAIIKGIPPRPKKKKFLQKGELQKLLRSLELGEGINMDWFILLVAKTGMRFAEAIALTPADFDWTRNTVSKAWSIVKLKCLVRILVSKQWINLNQSAQLIKTSSPFKNICICSGLVIQ